jgi:hypothetical protein
MERDFVGKKPGTTSGRDVGVRLTPAMPVGGQWLHDMCNAFAQLAHAVHSAHG